MRFCICMLTLYRLCAELAPFFAEYLDHYRREGLIDLHIRSVHGSNAVLSLEHLSESFFKSMSTSLTQVSETAVWAGLPPAIWTVLLPTDILLWVILSAMNTASTV